MKEYKAITYDNKCVVKINQENKYVLTLEKEVIDGCGNAYRDATFQNTDVNFKNTDIIISRNVENLYGTKSSDVILSRLTFIESKNLKHTPVYLGDLKYTPIDLEIDDKLFAIVTADRKCIVKGRKNTKFILATLDEPTNYKLFTCRQVKTVIANLKHDSQRLQRIWLTDTVKKLYNIKTYEQEKNLIDTLISVKVQVRYQIKED